MVREYSDRAVNDLQQLLDAVIFNLIVGNSDAHGKNFSLLYQRDGTIRMAPLYDVISTIAYPQLSRTMAMKIGGSYDIDAIHPRHFDKLAREAGLSVPQVLRRVSDLCEKVIAILPDLLDEFPLMSDLIDLIDDRRRTLEVRFQ